MGRILGCWLLSSTFFLSSSANADFDLLSTGYQHFGHSGDISFGNFNSDYNVQNIIPGSQSLIAHSAELRTADNTASGLNAMTIEYSQPSLLALAVVTNHKTTATIATPGITSDSLSVSLDQRFRGSSFVTSFFTASTSGDYQLSGQLVSRNLVADPGLNGKVAGVYGISGGVGLSHRANDGTITSLGSYEANTSIGDSNTVYEGFGPNQEFYQFSQVFPLVAGDTYLLQYGSSMLSTFGGTGSLEFNSGWNLQLVAVPEPTSLASIMFALIVSAVGFRFRSSKA
jgi:hypothetical protein